MKLSITFLFWFSLIITGCGNDLTINPEEVESSGIYQQYRLEQDLEKETLTAKIFFRKSRAGDFIRLKSEDLVKFKMNGKDLPMKIFENHRTKVPGYKVSTNFVISETITLGWSWEDDQTNNIYKTETTLRPFEVLEKSPGEGESLDRDELITIKWKKGLLPEERVNVTLKTDINNTHHNFYFYQTKDSSTKIEISTSKLKAGEYTVYMYREESLPVKNGTPEGGEVIKTIITPSYKIFLK